MGILDNMTSAMNRGAESVGRATEKTRLKGQLNELNKKRQGLAAQLGAALYPVTKDDAAMREGREALYDNIASCDAEREEIQKKIDELEAASQAAATASTSFRCAVCGATMSGGDMFCSGCGSPVDKARPAATGSAATMTRTCAACGAPMAEDDMFCMSCGAKAEAAPDPGDAVLTAVEVLEVVEEAGGEL